MKIPIETLKSLCRIIAKENEKKFHISQIKPGLDKQKDFLIPFGSWKQILENAIKTFQIDWDQWQLTAAIENILTTSVSVPADWRSIMFNIFSLSKIKANRNIELQRKLRELKKSK